MLNRYYGFSCSAFENTLDQRFLFMSKCHEKVIEALLYFIREKKSFALVCGDVGTGKTMIVHHLLGKLPRSVMTILIPYPDVEYIELLRYIARVLKKSTESKDVLELTNDVKSALIKANRYGKQVVLIIDEAHLLSMSSLENIRLLSNMEITDKKLLQILLVGQNELGLKLRRREMRQLRQRININCVLSPLSRSETIQYIDHRLKIAGAPFDRRMEAAGSCFDGCFEPECKKPLYAMTGGVPRSINQLCDTALLMCVTEQRDYRVTTRILKKARRVLKSGSVRAPGARFTDLFSNVFSHAAGYKIAFAAVTLILVLVLWGFKFNLGEGLKRLAYGPGVQNEVNLSVEKRPTLATEAASQGDLADEDVGRGVLAGPQESENLAAVSSEPKLADAGPDGWKVEKFHESFREIDAVPPTEEEALPKPVVPEETPAAYQAVDNNQGEPAEQGVKQAAAVERGNPDDAPQAGIEEKIPESDFFIVTIQKGESLYIIAKRFFPEDPEFGKRLILSANHIVDQNRIFAGRSLRVPRKIAVTESN